MQTYIWINVDIIFEIMQTYIRINVDIKSTNQRTVLYVYINSN